MLTTSAASSAHIALPKPKPSSTAAPIASMPRAEMLEFAVLAISQGDQRRKLGGQ